MGESVRAGGPWKFFKLRALVVHLSGGPERPRADTGQGEHRSAATPLPAASALPKGTRTESASQLLLGASKAGLLAAAQVPPRAVLIERQHRHRRRIGARLAPPAAFGRAIERGGDLLRVCL